MVATVQIWRYTGAAGATTNNITSINTRADTFDTHTTADTSNPIVVPASSSNYSYWVVTGLHCTVAPATLINNIKWYWPSSNTLGTGVTVLAAIGSAYTQASGTAGTTGIVLNSTNYGTGKLGTDSAGTNNSTQSDPFTNNNSSTPFSVNGSTSTTGDFGLYGLYQIVVGTTASPGPTAQITLTWQYDET